MFEITKTFVHETGFEITPFYMEEIGFIFLPKELEKQLGYENFPQTIVQSDSFKEGIEYLVLRNHNLIEFKELLRLLNSIEQPHDVGDESIKYSPSLIVLKEAGLYTAMILSRKPNSEIFRRWITCEVLPSIRKKGFYHKDSQGDTELSTTYKKSEDIHEIYNLLPKIVDNLKTNSMLPQIVDNLKNSLKKFAEDACQRLDQIEAVLAECKQQHDIFGGWKKIKMLVDDMTEIYVLTAEERRRYFSVLCQENNICLPEKAILDTEAMYYDAKTIAHKLGIYSTNGKPHVLFITALLDSLKLENYQKSSSSCTTAKYSAQAITAIKQWLKENRFPKKISLPWGKGGKERKFEVEYKKV